MQKHNSGIVVIEALLVMSLLALLGLANTNKNLKDDNKEQEQKIEECERLEDFFDHLEWKKYER